MRCWTSRRGDRQEYWIWAKRGGRLSEVASPAARTNSFRVQVPVCGNIASLVYLVMVYMSMSASMAPGTRATMWEEAALSSEVRGELLCAPQRSGWAHSKVKTALQYEPQWVSQVTVLPFSGW